MDRRAILCNVLLAGFRICAGNMSDADKHCETALEKLEVVEAPLLSYQAWVLLGHLQQAYGKSQQSYTCLPEAQSGSGEVAQQLAAATNEDLVHGRQT